MPSAIFKTESSPHLLLTERHENGLTYTYLSNSNLLTAKYTQDRDAILQREFYLYDASHNLIQKIVDDGSALERDNLAGVTERKITSYPLRKKPPFLDMPNRIEESYLEEGEERSFQKKQLIYDLAGRVVQEDHYDAEGNPVPKGHENSHLYPPGWVWWE